jgi:hypothetical protein
MESDIRFPQYDFQAEVESICPSLLRLDTIQANKMHKCLRL